MKELMLIITGFILLFIGLIWGVMHIEHRQCKNNIHEMGLNYKWDWVNGCRLEYEPGKYIFWQMYDMERNIY